MGSSASISGKLNPRAIPAGGIHWKLNRNDYEEWTGIQQNKYSSTFSWYGIENTMVYAPFHYEPGPPPIFYTWYKKCCEAWDDNPSPLAYPAWSWSDYQEMVQWFLLSGNPTIPSLFDSILAKKQESSINEKEKLIIAQLVFTLHLLMQDIRRAAISLGQRGFYKSHSAPADGEEWYVFPQDWKITRLELRYLEATDPNLMDIEDGNPIVTIASQLPGPSFYGPPSINIRNQLIYYYDTFLQYQGNPSNQEYLSKQNWFVYESEGTMKNWFNKTFGSLAKVAATLDQRVSRGGADLAFQPRKEPFKTWVSAFTIRVAADIHEALGGGFHTPIHWPIYWPKPIVYHLSLDIPIKASYWSKGLLTKGSALLSVDADKSVPPNNYWPLPTPTQVDQLLSLLPPFTKGSSIQKNATVSLHMSDLITLLSCIRFETSLDGFFPVVESTLPKEYHQGMDLNSIDIQKDAISSKNMELYGRIIGSLLPYAVGLKHRIAGRERSLWEWNQDGTYVIQGASQQQLQDCVEKKYRDAYESPATAPPPCIPEDIPAWSKPWELKGKELAAYLDAKAPQPGIRGRDFAIEEEDDYKKAVTRSQSDYLAWRTIIMSNPAKLQSFPIADKKTLPDGSVIENWYPNYGVWQFKPFGDIELLVDWMKKAWKGINAALWKHLFEVGAKIMEFIRNEFKKIGNEFPDAWKWGLALIGGLAVITASGVATKSLVDRL